MDGTVAAAGAGVRGEVGLVVRQVPAWAVDGLVDRESGSFLQLASWGRVKDGWEAEHVGWHAPDGTLVGAGTVLYRAIPRTRRSLAYLPEGPLLPWSDVAADPDRWLRPLEEHVAARGAFALRAGFPVVRRRWSAATVRAGFADGAVDTFADLPADTTDAAADRLAGALAERGWQPLGRGPGFADGQPRFGAVVPLAGRTPDDLHAALSSQWRRNLARARSRAVTVRRAGVRDLPVFHRLYAETAARDGFTPRPLTYFARMWEAFDGDAATSRLRLHLAEADGTALAGAVTVATGSRVTYVYGASTAHRRDVRAANALHWTVLTAAAEEGCTVYDLRGIGDTLDDEDALAGLLRFKLGLRGDCVEYLGEWERPLSPLWHKAFRVMLAVRGRRRRSAGTGGGAA